MSSTWSNVPITCVTWAGHNHLLTGQGQVLLLLEAKSGPFILYSGMMVETDLDLPMMMAGTVMGEVLMWRSDTGEE